jgi:hypothetical protein
MKALPLLIALLTVTPASAHDQWADGSAVPSWVKSACCGARDIHQTTMDQVHEAPNGWWRVDGIGNLVPPDKVFPSQDGYVWVFYDPNVVPDARSVHCLFIVESF